MNKYPPLDKHITHSQQFTKDYLFALFAQADDLRRNMSNYKNALQGKIVATLFYEPSTRTRMSFESAIQLLGGFVITTENAGEFSSGSKGETIEDTIRVMSQYCDAIVLRHTEDDSSKRALATTTVPIINAGSGKSQHPTQALLDVYTIFRKFGRLDHLHIAVVGDLLHGRTCDSLVYILSKFSGNTFSFVAPEVCRVKESLRTYLTNNDMAYQEFSAMDEVIESVDVLYVTRVQKERFADNEAYEKAKGSYILTQNLVCTMKENAIIMHPLPRVDEISTEVDNDPRAMYFEQAGNGLYIRTALLLFLLARDLVLR